MPPAPAPASAAVRTVARDCIANKVRILNRTVTALYEEAVGHHGLKVSQMNVLVAITVMGTPTAGDVGDALHLEKSTLSRNLERLRARGWVETLPGDDARSQRLCTTSVGRSLLERALPDWRKAQRRAARILGADTVEAISAAIISTQS